MVKKKDIRILASVPDYNGIAGGIKKIYHHIDSLNDLGYSAFVLHSSDGFRCDWFENKTPVLYRDDVKFSTSDVLILPEIGGPLIAERESPNVKKVIMNLNWGLTFKGYGFDLSSRKNSYLRDDVVAIITNSDYGMSFLNSVFPSMQIFKARNCIDESLFNFSRDKENVISFLPRRNKQDAETIINMLKFKGALDNYSLNPIEGLSEKDVADAFKKSKFFFSFSNQEGFGRPPAEAMACGNVVIGYSAFGGSDFFNPAYSFDVPNSNVIAFANIAEQALSLPENRILEMGIKASNYILNNYSSKNELTDVKNVWESILDLL